MDNVVKKLWHLDEFNFFSELVAEQKTFLKSRTIMRQFKKGNIIYYSADITRNIYFLKQGRVKLTSADGLGHEMIIYIIMDQPKKQSYKINHRFKFHA